MYSPYLFEPDGEIIFLYENFFLKNVNIKAAFSTAL